MYQYRATHIRTVDGDTVDLRVDLGFRMATVQRFRLLGIDTPERGQRGYGRAKNELDIMFRQLKGEPVTIETAKSDSFGRWLATIYPPAQSDCGARVSFNQRLLDAGLAVRYER